MCLTDAECQDRCRLDEGYKGHLPSERSACLTGTECQGKCLLDDVCHGICLQDEECQCICLLDAVRVLQMQSVKADVILARGVRVFAFWTQRISPDAESQGKCLLDIVCYGICLPDEECHGICLLDAVHVLQVPSVKADVIRTRGVRTFEF